MKVFTLLLLVLGCSHIPTSKYVCITKCGLTTEYLLTTEQCNEIRTAEFRFVATVSRYLPEYSAAYVCSSINGWTLAYREVPWRDSGGMVVVGLADCRHRRISMDIPTAASNTLYHELMHVVEECEPDHPSWSKRGVCDIIDRCSGTVDKWCREMY